MSKVILVEDDANLRATFKELLSIMDYEVVRVYKNGGEAYVDLRKNPVQADILITDFFMPVMNADEIIKSIASNENYKNLQYIVVSGFDIDSVIKCFPEDSGIKFLTKPFKVDDLVKVLG
ncbi:MAG: hypothetical protein RL754_423 [Bacteroidota bacterium]|jgi:YesN/AraC family two-component response regulator